MESITLNSQELVSPSPSTPDINVEDGVVYSFMLLRSCGDPVPSTITSLHVTNQLGFPQVNLRVTSKFI